MRKIIILIFILQSSLAFSQIQQYFFVDDVDYVESVTVKICIGENGETTSVTEIPEKSTYKNKEVIAQIIEYRKGFDFYPESQFSNKCFEFPFKVVNSKYESLTATNVNCKDKFGKGRFKYIASDTEEVKIIRRKKKQIEKVKGSKSVYKIEWNSNSSYVLTYLKVFDPKAQYLIGQEMEVKILDVLDDGSYFYYSNLSNRTYSFGIIKKL